MAKCSECGFLAARNTQSRKLEEVEEQSRQDGNIGKQRYVLVPVCFVRSINIKEEAKLLWHDDKRKRDEPDWSGYVKKIINAERECKPFTEWHQGFEPKEHQEMLDRQWQLDYQAKREKEDRDYTLDTRLAV